ncbi:LRR receptor-like serine/threonine-protein kinase [Pyrus ussuriensis x Pyrus communis]|uniref:LRR receptor-like serine/threonine-protein kinase n=1 Tax=Pyrus ussuriensis x Pyrus communis TaxID=2448454 RepID=A0A5N5IHL7_9ROSA|nr:LRR receptor-like serine/threonine-protein kinase [Pyrus ussuriensis x Pyrus communis]
MHDSASRNMCWPFSFTPSRRASSAHVQYPDEVDDEDTVTMLPQLLLVSAVLSRTELTESAVRALNSIFEQWDTQPVPGLWNINGEPQ